MNDGTSSSGASRPCQNEVEQIDGTAPLCLGTLTFRPGDVQAKCDTCGGWEGVNAPRQEAPKTASRIADECPFAWCDQHKVYDCDDRGPCASGDSGTSR